MANQTEFELFITQLSDHELSIFAGYRYQSFMNSSRNKISEEIKNRNLTKKQTEQYLQEPLNVANKDTTSICKRCGSDKLFIETDYEQKLRGGYNLPSSIEVAINSNRCRLCGYNPSKETPKNLFERILRIFKSHRTEKIIRRGMR